MSEPGLTYEERLFVDTPDSMELLAQPVDLFERWQHRMTEELAKVFGIPAEHLCTNSASPSSGSTLTAEALLQTIREFGALPPVPPPVRIYESSAAVEQGPRVRTYARRRARTEAHWRRMDKKWLKRYGYRMLPTAYRVDLPHETMVVVHPLLVREFRARVDRCFVDGQEVQFV
jgi:hypothetical protein